MNIAKHIYIFFASILLSATPVMADVTLTPTEDTWLYGYAQSYQGSDGAYYGESEFSEVGWDISSGPLNDPNVSAEDDPIFSAGVDDYLLDGNSSFAIGRVGLSNIDGWTYPGSMDNFKLYVNNQSTQDPGGCTGTYGPEALADSVVYMLVTYDTSPSGGSSIGEPMNITLDLSLSEELFAFSEDDQYFMEVGYSLGQNLDINTFDGYNSWYGIGGGPDPQPVLVSYSDSLVYSGFIGDQVQVLIALASYTYSFCGYTWTKAMLASPANALQQGALNSLMRISQGETQDSAPLSSLSATITVTTPGEATLFGPQIYTRGRGKPEIVSATFEGGEGEAVLIIHNADENGGHRISSAVITVNGEEIVGPGDINVYNLEVPLNLQDGNNSVSVQLRGKPGSYLTIEIIQ